MMRFEGPVVRQNQYLFASDWMEAADGDNLEDLLKAPLPEGVAGFTAQVIGTGPTVRHSAMPEVFESLMYAAREELFITTPYYVPDESMQGALCASARRGVKTTIIFPARNDSFIVGGASRSYYAELLEAGVQIHEYEGGLLHTKSLTIDGKVTLIGSANMDRRSFDLNYENNILLCDEAITAEMRARQDAYLAHSHPVTTEMVAAWPAYLRFWNNLLAMLGPVL
jgi:cardiolipin synthase